MLVPVKRALCARKTAVLDGKAQTSFFRGDAETIRSAGNTGSPLQRNLLDESPRLCVEQHVSTAAWRCGGNQTLLAVDGNGPDIVGKACGCPIRQVDEFQRIATFEMPDQRRQIIARTLILTGKPDAAIAAEIDMAGGELAQICWKIVFFDQATGLGINQRQRRLHVIEIELGAAEIRVGFDAAIGSNQD